MRPQPADSIKARGSAVPQLKAEYMAAIVTCLTTTKERALQTGERPYMVRSSPRVESAIIINEWRHGGPRIASVLSATEPN
jgi:hypothetical protein